MAEARHPLNLLFSFRMPTLTLCFLLGIPLLSAGAPQSPSPLSLFEARYKAARSLSAVFLEQFMENGRVTRKEAGKSYFLRPGKMRWDYEAPEKNMFLADGKYVWFYAPADRTVTRMPAKNSEDWRTPLAFLTTGMKLSRICARVEPALETKPSQVGYLVYRCQLRSSNQPDTTSSGIGTNVNAKESDSPKRGPSVLFELSPQGELSRIVVHEEAGVEIEFRFRDWQWNPAISNTLFQFEPPPGVVIVNGVLPDTPGLRQ